MIVADETKPKTDRLSSEEDAEELYGSQSEMSAVKLTKKKKEYKSKNIEDKSGVYNYDVDPDAYKKARKRL